MGNCPLEGTLGVFYGDTNCTNRHESLRTPDVSIAPVCRQRQAQRDTSDFRHPTPITIIQRQHNLKPKTWNSKTSPFSIFYVLSSLGTSDSWLLTPDFWLPTPNSSKQLCSRQWPKPNNRVTWNQKPETTTSRKKPVYALCSILFHLFWLRTSDNPITQ